MEAPDIEIGTRAIARSRADLAKNGGGSARACPASRGHGETKAPCISMGAVYSRGLGIAERRGTSRPRKEGRDGH